MSTTAQLVERVRILANQVGSKSTHPDKEFIQVGLNPIARAVVAQALTVSKSTTISIVAATSSYSVPAAITPFIKASSVTFGTNKEILEWKDNSEISNITYTGTPRYWTYWDNKIKVAPIPNANGTLYFDAYGGPVPIVEQTPAASTDELGFPSDAEDAVVYGSAMVMCSVDNEQTRGRQWAEMYAAKLAELRTRLNPAGDTPSVISNADSSDSYFCSYF